LRPWPPTLTVYGTTSRGRLDMGTLNVSARSRLHFGLVDLVGATPRRFGGLGAMLEQPSVKVVCEPAKVFTIIGGAVDDRLRKSVLSAAARYQSSVGGEAARFEVVTSPPRHIGLGSGTATVMACLQGLDGLVGGGVARAKLGEMSGRGGASGTGVNGYWHGGWIVDAGQPLDAPVLPSGLQVPIKPSLMTQRLESPAWAVDLYLPPGVQVSGVAESRLFRRAAANEGMESLQALALLHHGLVPALLSSDLPTFGDYMGQFQALSLKRLEIGHQGPEVASLKKSLMDSYPCVAMSSMGPILAAFRGIDDPVPSLGHEPYLTNSRISGTGASVQWAE